MAYLLLGGAQAVGLLLIPFGAPGLWLQVAAVVLFGWWSGFALIGVAPMLAIFVIALTTELLEGPLSGGRLRPEVRRNLSFAGMLGAGLGAAAGAFLIPLLGSLFGAVVGAFFGTTLIAPVVRSRKTGWGELIGQVFAIAVRTGAAVAIAAYVLLTLIP